MNNKYYLYILNLEDKKFYIGVTTKLSDRLDQHNNGYGSKWTKLYKPISVLQTKDLGYLNYHEASLYENHVTYLYIKKYGTSRVRGGSFCAVKPSPRSVAIDLSKFRKLFDK